MPDKELDVSTRCRFKNVAGGQASMDLHVAKAQVMRFMAQIEIPQQGSCHFDMKQFEQTARMPNVVLTDKESTCTVRMWEQGQEVTIAFSGCQSKCEQNAANYLWPIVVDRRNGHCT